MNFMQINPNDRRKNYSKKASSANSVTIMVNGKEMVVTQERIKKASKELSKMAYLLGRTNDEDGYNNEVSEDIFEALKRYSKKKGKKR